MHDFRSVIELWSRRTDFAAAVGISAIVASAWWQRNSIPAERFNDVVSAAQAKGHSEVTHKLLADLAQARAAAKSQPAQTAA